MKRRTFLTTAVAGSTACLTGIRPADAAPESKLRLAVIGIANRGNANLSAVADQNIVALCDVDANYLQKTSKRFPDAALFGDYREMFDQFNDIDAVVVSTPDFHHAPAAMRAIEHGYHVYCEKPLTHTVAEARALTQAAAKAGVVTQMGTQIHAGENYRRVVEKIRAGAIGDVSEVHVWVGKGWGAKEMPKPDGSSAPENLDWDVWLGPAESRPYIAGLHPAQWRRYRDFGAGTLGDMGCHYMDLPFWALGLRYPERIVADGPAPDPECCPLGLSVRYDFAASSQHDDLSFVWYDGNRCPKTLKGRKLPGSGVLFVGEKGTLLSTYSNHDIQRNDGQKVEIKIDSTIAPSIGHHAEWLRAIAMGDPSGALCRFDYSGPLTESVLLGTVAHRVGRPVRWDGDAATVVDDPQAAALLTKSYRQGFELHGQPALATR